MFVGIQQRIVSLWFPRLASDRILRRRPAQGPFALTIQQHNINRIHCLNIEAIQRGLGRGMSYADARAFCPDLQTQAAEPEHDLHFLHTLRRWATLYCPWVGLEGQDGLVLDISGSAHLFGGEEPMLTDMRARLARAGITVRIGLADTRGAAWALAHYAEGIAPQGGALAAIRNLPVSALRIDQGLCTSLHRVGLRRIDDLLNIARAPLARRFGPGLLNRLDQALGNRAEEISPLAAPPCYAVRMTLPEPIGLLSDVLASTKRLLNHLCKKLRSQDAGACQLRLELRLVDQKSQSIELHLARPLQDAERLLKLMERHLEKVDAGFGIDQLRLEATKVETLSQQQTSHLHKGRQDRLEDLISRIGTRIGLENVRQFRATSSHIPERSFAIAPISFSSSAAEWPRSSRRPICFFPPEPIAAPGPRPPRRFRWRQMVFTTGRAIGPERISPEWWRIDDNWHSGLRDYWRIETDQGHRLWVFFTPQNPGWFVQGAFA